MTIKAIATVDAARVTDGAYTIVLEMVDGSGEPVRLLLPAAVLDRAMDLLIQAGKQSAEMLTARKGSAA